MEKLHQFFQVSFVPTFVCVDVALGTAFSRLFDAWCVDRFGVRRCPDSEVLFVWRSGQENLLQIWVTKKELTKFGHKKEFVRIPTTTKFA